MRVGPKSNDRCPDEKAMWRHQGRCLRKDKVTIGVRLPQAKRPPEGHSPADTLILDFQFLELRENKFVVLIYPVFWHK